MSTATNTGPAASLAVLADDAARCFLRADRGDPGHDLTLTLALRRVRVRCADAATVLALMPALEHHARAPAGDASPDLEIRAWHGDAPGAVPQAPRDLQACWARGDFAASRAHVAHPHGQACVVTVYDRVHAVAHWWIRDLGALPGWERAAPFRPILQWWARDRGGQLAHAAAVGRNGRGVLLVGRGGSGKSTTALSCLQAGLEFAGDDYVLVREDAHGWRAHALYGSAKIDGDRLDAWFAPWRPQVTTRAEAHGKWIVPVAALAGAHLAPSLQLAALVAPVLGTGARPRVERISAQAAMLAMAPSTVFQLPGTGADAVGKLARLSRALPAWRLHLVADPARNAAAIARLLRSLAEGPA